MLRTDVHLLPSCSPTPVSCSWPGGLPEGQWGLDPRKGAVRGKEGDGMHFP